MVSTPGGLTHFLNNRTTHIRRAKSRARRGWCAIEMRPAATSAPIMRQNYQTKQCFKMCGTVPRIDGSTWSRASPTLRTYPSTSTATSSDHQTGVPTWADFTYRMNAMGPPGAGQLMATSQSWVLLTTQLSIPNSTVESFMLSIGLHLVVMLTFTWNFLLAVYIVVTTASSLRGLCGTVVPYRPLEHRPFLSSGWTTIFTYVRAISVRMRQTVGPRFGQPHPPSAGHRRRCHVHGLLVNLSLPVLDLFVCATRGYALLEHCDYSDLHLLLADAAAHAGRAHRRLLRRGVLAALQTSTTLGGLDVPRAQQSEA